MHLDRRSSLRRVAVCLCALSLLPGLRGAAQSPQYEVIHTFRGLPGGARAPLCPGSDGVLYGLTSMGGSGGVGAVFAARPTAGGGLDVSFIHEFERSEGGASSAGLIEGSDGAFYGTTPAYGTHGLGSLFRVTPSGAFSVLHAFSGPDGARPQSALVLASDGNFYGTTLGGGANGHGTVFRLTPDGMVTTLHAFTGETGDPKAPLVQAGDGALYGTTGWADGSIASAGSVFRITLAGAFSTVHVFGPLEYPSIPLTLGPDGLLYGAQSWQVLFTSFFKISLSGEYSLINPGGAAAQQRLVLGADGHFYGTASGGAFGYGTAFRLTADGTYTTLHDFTEEEGTPASGLTAFAGGFAGATSTGGMANHGGLYVMTAEGAATVAYEFTGTDGDLPWASPTRAINGALFGTTVRGGPHDRGTVYRIWPGGQVSILHSFSGADGALPYAALVPAHDGYLYGTTAEGGCHGRGTVFKVSPLFGTFTSVHCFTPAEGRTPFASLLQATNGLLYGTTVAGGPNDQGTIFTVGPGGAVTTIYSFGPPPQPWASAPYNRNPLGALIESSDGFFYGTTWGVLGGSIFRLRPDGTVTTLAVARPTFTCCFYFYPGLRFAGDLTDTPGGDLYVAGQSTTSSGAALLRTSRLGPVLGGPVEPITVHTFSGATGSYVSNPPIAARDGYFYGVTGTYPEATGSIYRIDLNGDGTLTTVKVLSDGEGVAPMARLVEGPDGRLYGTATSGGPGGRGVVFSVRPE